MEVYAYFILFLAVNVLHIGFCSYPTAFAKDFEVLMEKIEHFSMDLYHRGGMQRNNNRVKGMLIETVRLHIKLIR